MLYLCYLCQFKPLRDHLRGFLIAAWAGDKIAEFSFPKISFHFSLRPWFFFVSPAYAGKSSCLWWRKWPCRDHPRVCGEKLNTHLTFPPSSGSPPRMRGKVMLTRWPFSMSGITPAYAGKRIICPKSAVISWDHPRVCGEKLRLPAVRFEGVGSPPHVRGKAYRKGSGTSTTGITPACAGKRAATPSGRCSRGDHPRMCGEKAILNHPVHVCQRITPACAGKSRCHTLRFSRWWDHPRMCGEKTKKIP